MKPSLSFPPAFLAIMVGVSAWASNLVEVSALAAGLQSSGGTAPAISVHPQSHSAVPKGSVTFQVTVQGTPPLQFQWRHAGTNLALATNDSLTLTHLSTVNSGSYDVVVRNDISAVTSRVATLTIKSAPKNPALRFTSIPEYGSFADLRGLAVNVNPQDYRVAIYIYVFGWWTKPYWAQPTVALDSLGRWSCDITTGGMDQNATRLAAFLVPASVTPPLMTGGSPLPDEMDAVSVARLIVNRGGRTVHFSGYDWIVKNGYWGPGPNTFSDSSDNVWVDNAGRLHLRISNRAGQWQCAEIISAQSLGYGRYQFELDSRADLLDPNAVLGLFTWSDAAAYAHREIDIEFSRWSIAGRSDNAQYVVQPYEPAGHLVRFVQSAANQSLHRFTWSSSSVAFESYDSLSPAGSNLLSQWTFASPGQVPPSGDENVHLNLWLFNGAPPSDGQPVEVVIRKFDFAAIGPPAIRVQPTNQLVNAGDNVNFIVEASSLESPGFQWRFNGVDLPGATNSTLRLEQVATNQAGTYALVAWNSSGSVTSKVATLKVRVNLAPVIRSQPVSRIVEAGASVTFAVLATNPPPLRFQWKFNDSPIPGATNDFLTLNGVTAATAGRYSVTVRNTWGVSNSLPATLRVIPASLPRQSAQASLAHLSGVMDAFHSRFWIYEDISSAGNHFHARGKFPDETAPVWIDGSWTNRPHSGSTCIRCVFRNPTGDDFGGFYFLNGLLPEGYLAPVPYFGEAVVPGTNIAVNGHSGINLSGATVLTFWAKGQWGGEQIEFFIGGVGRDPGNDAAVQPFPDSCGRRPRKGVTFTLSTTWQKFGIDLSGLNLTNIMGGFGWVANGTKNPYGAVFYLDDIQYELSPARRAQQLDEPRFLRSFNTGAKQPNPFDANTDDDLDLVLRNTAYTYDNALAVIAFLAAGTDDGLRRARLIGEAFIYALAHDRTFTNGLLRTGYSAGDLALPSGWFPNGKSGTVPIPGFYFEQQQRFYEVEQGALDVGNNAWGMIALLALYERTGEQKFLSAAEQIGNSILQFRNDTGRYRGFQGGIWNPEGPNPTRRIYASTEHNLDLFAAFGRLYALTGESRWHDQALHAREFVEAMWDETHQGFLAGTADPETLNRQPNQLPLDTQSWAVLALGSALTNPAVVLACADRNHRNVSDGFDGYDFNNDRDGVWFEGSAQMAVAKQMVGDVDQGARLRALLRSAQRGTAGGDGKGLMAASHDGVSSGFDFKLFRRLHVGATAWNVFAQLAYNPYYQEHVTALPPAIVSQPTNILVMTGKPINLRIDALGLAPLRYRWLQDGRARSVVGESLAIAKASVADGGDYRVIVTNEFGAATSAVFHVSVLEISAQPRPRLLPGGTAVTLAVGARGSDRIGYQWEFNGAEVQNATNANLTLRAISLSEAGSYRVRMCLASGCITSAIATLAIVAVDPTNAVISVGDSIEFRSELQGTVPVGWQWLRNGQPIRGATNSTLLLPAVTAGEAGLYSVWVKTPLGSVNSARSRLTVQRAASGVSGAIVSLSGGLNRIGTREIKLSLNRVGLGGWRLSLAGLPGEKYRLEATSDLVSWKPLGVVSNQTGIVNWFDPEVSGGTTRFYRASIISGGD